MPEAQRLPRTDIATLNVAMLPKTTPPDTGKTKTAIEGEAVPRLPHERDESSDSGTSPPREIMRKAKRDIDAGRVDTDRGAAADAAYQKQK
ncbi:MAG: hypothetical protein K8R60_01635 [Burkholderiales bacterium]|nr:hypothetical protein [Burkholderiales bacterium]